MLVFRAFTAGLVLAFVAVAAAPAHAQAPESRYPGTSFELALGYGAPYGWGLGLSHMLTPSLDATVGVGLTITGAKVGVGTRYYFSPARKVSPFVGGNLVYSTGFNHLTITSNNQTGSAGYNYTNDDVVVNFKSTALLHLRGGVRWQPTYRFALLGALGYGIVLGGDPVEYVSGPPYSEGTRNLVSLFSPGGVELSVGVAFGLGSRN